MRYTNWRILYFTLHDDVNFVDAPNAVIGTPLSTHERMFGFDLCALSNACSNQNILKSKICILPTDSKEELNW